MLPSGSARNSSWKTYSWFLVSTGCIRAHRGGLLHPLDSQGQRMQSSGGCTFESLLCNPRMKQTEGSHHNVQHVNRSARPSRIDRLFRRAVDPKIYFLWYSSLFQYPSCGYCCLCRIWNRGWTEVTMSLGWGSWTCSLSWKFTLAQMATPSIIINLLWICTPPYKVSPSAPRKSFHHSACRSSSGPGWSYERGLKRKHLIDQLHL